MNNNISDGISEQTPLTQQAIKDILVTANDFLATISGQLINEFSSSVQIMFQQLISACCERINEDLPEIQEVIVHQLNEALSASLHSNNMKRNVFDSIIEITDIPISEKISFQNDTAHKIDIYQLINIIIAAITLIHSLCNPAPWSKLLQIEEERLAVEKEQSAKDDVIIQYLQAYLELLSNLPELNPENPGLPEESSEI